MEKKQIEVPSFVKKMNDIELEQMVSGMSDGTISVYAQIRDENSEVVGFKKVYLKDEKNRTLQSLYDQLNDIKESGLIKRISSLKRAKEIRIAISKLKEMQSYSMFSTGKELTISRRKLWESDIAQTARDIKEYRNTL